jgi:hypothetical protein
MEAGIASALKVLGLGQKLRQRLAKKGIYPKTQHAQKTPILCAGIRVFSGLIGLKREK